MKSIQDAVDILNDMVKLDADAMGNLINARVSCNKALVDHPTVTVTHDSQVGILGVLNGIFLNENERIVVMWDKKTGKLVSFGVIVSRGERQALA